MDTQNNLRNRACDPLAQLENCRLVVGSKQLRKAISAGKARVVFLAENADPAITEPLEAMCRQQNIPCVWTPDKQSLGRRCGIEVGAAAAAAVE